MTLLSMCNRVLSENGFPEYLTIVGNSDPGAKQILSLSSAAIRALTRDYDWPQLITLTSFPTIIGTPSYACPADFKKPVLDTLFDDQSQYIVRAAITSQQWTNLLYGDWASTALQKFRVVYDGVTQIASIYLAPTPSDVRTYYYMYLSNNPVRSGAANVARFLLDADTMRIPEEVVELGLRWRFRRAKGLDHSSERAEYEETCKSQVAAYRHTDEIPVGGPIWPWDYVTCGTIPESGFGV